MKCTHRQAGNSQQIWSPRAPARHGAGRDHLWPASARYCSPDFFRSHRHVDLADAEFSERVEYCIGDGAECASLFERYRPDSIMNLAAESHVDRSIDGPAECIQTNIVGTFTLLEETLRYWSGLEPAKRTMFRFLHVSTDEVYGSLGSRDLFTENTLMRPIRLIRPAKQLRTTWFAPGTKLTSYQP